MNNYYLAIDIGASGGRHILGHLENNKLVTEEIYRFDNSLINEDGRLVWDIDSIFGNVLEGMKRCRLVNKIPVAVGIDTWGVDFVLLDENGERIGSAVSYRDLRTDGMPGKVEKLISSKVLYARTGIQKQQINTIYQLMALKEQNPDDLIRAKHMLMLPDYLCYRLTGVYAQEYTNATTTGLVKSVNKDWDYSIIEKLGLHNNIFEKISLPGTFLGSLTPNIKEQLGYNTKVYMTTSHDTASAIVAVATASENTLYISSGTWSLMGAELTSPICSEKARKYNFTNEGGYDYRFRFLKNIMGLWMIQCVRKELCPDTDYQSIGEAAAIADIDSIIDVNDSRFLSPQSMVNEINAYLEETNRKIPATIGEYAKIIYRSLAVCYKETLEETEKVTGKKFPVINIVGGGSNCDFLNQQTANEIKRPVTAGPSEATAIGNMLVLMIARKEIDSLRSARIILEESVDIKKYKPEK